MERESGTLRHGGITPCPHPRPTDKQFIVSEEGVDKSKKMDTSPPAIQWTIKVVLPLTIKFRFHAGPLVELGDFAIMFHQYF